MVLMLWVRKWESSGSQLSEREWEEGFSIGPMFLLYLDHDLDLARQNKVFESLENSLTNLDDIKRIYSKLKHISAIRNDFQNMTMIKMRGKPRLNHIYERLFIYHLFYNT